MPADSVSTSPGKAGPNLIFIGPPGAGKGSLADKLCSLNLEHVSSGDFFRAEVARNTPLGAAFEKALQKGEFVPDEATLAVMRKWYFGRKGNAGFLLDGFPRNLLQAKVFAEWMAARRESLAGCIYLKLSFQEAVRRITERRICPADGSVYHLSFYPPKTEGRCDRCGGPLVQRSDDTEETVLHRWNLFERHTLPLVSFYREQGILMPFDASAPLEEIQNQVLTAVETLT